MACRFSKRKFYILTAICMVTWVFISYLAIQSGNSVPDRDSGLRYNGEVGQGHGVTLKEFYDPNVVEMGEQQDDSSDIKEEDDSDEDEAEDDDHGYKKSNKNIKVDVNHMNNKGKHGEHYEQLKDKHADKEKLGKSVNLRGHVEEMNKHILNDAIHGDIEADDKNADAPEYKEEERAHDDDNNEEEDDEDDNEEKENDDEEDNKAAKYIPEDFRVKQQLAPVEDDGEDEDHNEEDLDGNKAHDDHEHADDEHEHIPERYNMKDVLGSNGKTNILFKKLDDGDDGADADYDNDSDANARNETNSNISKAANKKEEEYNHTRYKIKMPPEDNENKNKTN